MKKIAFVGLFILGFFPAILAQSSKTVLLEFTNANAQFTVPAGKSWIINSVFSDYVTDCVKNGDYYDCSDIYIFIERLNNVEKTNAANLKYGPLLYRTNNSFSTHLPIHLPAGTNLELVILKGYTGNMEPYNGSAFVSITEVQE